MDKPAQDTQPHAAASQFTPEQIAFFIKESANMTQSHRLPPEYLKWIRAGMPGYTPPADKEH